MADKRKYEKFRTPEGEAIYPALSKPDTRFNDDGVFKSNVAFEDGKEIRSLIAFLDKIRDEHFDELDAKKRKTYTKEDVFEEELDDAGEETGRLIMKFKLKAIVRPKGKEPFEQHPHLFDCAKPEPNLLVGINPWTGTKLKISGEVVPYDMAIKKSVGVSLRLKAAQIIDLVEGGGANAASYGFDSEDGGFEMESNGSEDFDASEDEEDDEF